MCFTTAANSLSIHMSLNHIWTKNLSLHINTGYFPPVQISESTWKVYFWALKSIRWEHLHEQ